MTRLSVIAALLLTACTPTAVQVQGDAAILPGSAAKQMLVQCSREAPEPGEGTWVPDWSDIAALEAALPEALAGRSETGAFGHRKPPEGWSRHYVGLVRDGRRFVYGSFFPTGSGVESSPDEVVRICDGGPAFFGVEFDVGARRFTHLAFNGMA
ncbi:hypothetical protein [Brevundimonas sp.]|uniref:hypothetical protein n=1 Tax=Brevundimonas sp. TaxID=1871086 RepID=UPI0025C4BF5E|nr:hypothetical protein [Brevundimonas sp.]